MLKSGRRPGFGPATATTGVEETMHENELRELIEEVRSGTLPRRSFIQQLVGLGLSAPMASMLLMHAGVAQRAAGNDVQADQARRRRGPQGAVVAGRDAAATALCQRHEGPGRLAHLL